MLTCASLKWTARVVNKRCPYLEFIVSCSTTGLKLWRVHKFARHDGMKKLMVGHHVHLHSLSDKFSDSSHCWLHRNLRSNFCWPFHWLINDSWVAYLKPGARIEDWDTCSWLQSLDYKICHCWVTSISFAKRLKYLAYAFSAMNDTLAGNYINCAGPYHTDL